MYMLDASGKLLKFEPVDEQMEQITAVADGFRIKRVRSVSGDEQSERESIDRIEPAQMVTENGGFAGAVVYFEYSEGRSNLTFMRGMKVLLVKNIDDSVLNRCRSGRYAETDYGTEWDLTDISLVRA